MSTPTSYLNFIPRDVRDMVKDYNQSKFIVEKRGHRLTPDYVLRFISDKFDTSVVITLHYLTRRGTFNFIDAVETNVEAKLEISRSGPFEHVFFMYKDGKITVHAGGLVLNLEPEFTSKLIVALKDIVPMIRGAT